MSVYEIPLTSRAQRLTVTIAGRTVRLTLAWRNAGGAGWCLDVADADGTPLVCGLPLVTGADLLGQHRHLGLPFALAVQGESGDPDEVPTYAGLGTRAKLYAVTAEA